MKSTMPVKKQMPKKDATDQNRLRDILFFLLVLFYKVLPPLSHPDVTVSGCIFLLPLHHVGKPFFHEITANVVVMSIKRLLHIR